MKFFLPAAKDDAEGEREYASLRLRLKLPAQRRRIWKLVWEHNGMLLNCEVGKPGPSYFQTGAEPVVAIFDSGSCYHVITLSRGFTNDGPILAGKGLGSIPTYFDDQ